MDADYWLQRWKEGSTGWHRDAVMPLLQQHWPALDIPSGTQVLVPLCGKTLDMLWLADQGLQVLGVELSSFAIEQFCADNDLDPVLEQTEDGPCYHAGNIRIIQNNVLDLSSATLATCGAFYDRAAVIAQTDKQRTDYAARVFARLPGHCRGLMITLDYPQHEMSGPPFSVDQAELQKLFGHQWQIRQLERRDILDSQPGFGEAGVTALHTAVYDLRRQD